MDLFQKCRDYKRVDKAVELGVYPYFHKLTSGQDTEVIMGGHHTYMLGSNNYLGLTADPRIKEAAIEAVQRYGSGCSGSRFLNGNLDIHEKLEAELADFLHKEAAMIVSTGFQTNLAVISAIAGKDDVILSDQMNHASIIDGTRLSFAKVVKYRHSNMADLERRLQHLRDAEETHDAGLLIVTDGVFSMEGEICNLPGIVELAKRYNARILLDDAHALGVIGEGGRGTASYFGLEDEVDMIMNTFSKSLASLGGAVVASSEVIRYLRHTSRPFIFSASITPAQTASARRALEILREEPERVERIHSLVRRVKDNFRDSKHVVVHNSGNELVPIIPLLTGTAGRTAFVANYLFENEIYVNPVFPPVVPANSCLLRMSLMATHSDEQIDRACEIIERCFREVDAMDLSEVNIDF
ncbi:MAG: aminotransferase class I/II-fold pyridoxal phosphate-dependent enzyme [Eubacteriales bacterium]|nr:aminotransferase class I/II-fold pyridoxal phosphate-dependent enzyme [Eubacteriales bacterium]